MISAKWRKTLVAQVLHLCAQLLFAEMELYSLQSNATMEILQMEMGAVLYVRLNQQNVSQASIFSLMIIYALNAQQYIKNV